MITIYHNGECSKSKGALELLQESGAEHEVRWYLTDPLATAELKELLAKLGMQPSQIVRKSEPLCKELYEGKTLDEAQWLSVLHEHPVLMERPIAVKGSIAIIARPPERINELL
ncbi:MAG: arsenate reductase family protein [Bacteroidota bacterium]